MNNMFHLSRRKDLPWYGAWGIRGAAILLALIICAVVTALTTGVNPLSVYGTMWEGAFSTSRRTWTTLQNIAVLLIISLALTPAFRMRFWNVGGEGQVLIGALATAACMILLGDKVSDWILIPLELLCALATGAVWGALPAFFKARWNTNETLFTLMMNYVATQLVAFFVIVWEVPKGAGKIGIINQSTNSGWLPTLFGQKYMIIVLTAVLLVGIMYIYLNRSKQGYELTVVGESMRTARYVGIKVDRVIIRTVALSGALCALAGFLLVAGADHTVTTTLSDSRGFTGVMVAWLAKFNPVGMVATSTLLVFLDRGAAEISTKFGMNQSFGDILTGIILFCIIGSEFFINYKISVRRSGSKEEKEHV